MNALAAARLDPYAPQITSADPGKFAIRNLSILAYSQGFTLWRFDGARTGTTLTQIGAAGFFSAAGDRFNAGDHIHLGAVDGGALAYVVRSGRDVVVQMMGMAFVPGVA